MSQSDPQRRRTARIAPAVEQQIDENLRLLYRQQMEEELPDTLKTLIARLREEGSKS